MRADGRVAHQVRPIEVLRDYIIYPEGSVLISMGQTKVLCNVTVEDRLPPWLIGKGQGWVTAEYSMLPRATHTRTQRPQSSGRPDSRSLEISRLIGRALRAVTNMSLLGERTFTVDCDVLQADGGTRTAAITGSYLALERSIKRLTEIGKMSRSPLTEIVAAVSVGVVDGEAVVDLSYDEDSRAEVDMNVVMDSLGRFIEIQGTAEKVPFDQERLRELLGLAKQGIEAIFNATRSTKVAMP